MPNSYHSHYQTELALNCLYGIAFSHILIKNSGLSLVNGYGIMCEYPIERIYAGTNEIMKIFMAKSLLWHGLKDRG